ncbi:programmed cell death protein 7-like [Argiope bruennichi]|uniref:Programmed cell death protein 7 like protein n=1 Tax=Argiope bruennichi TaxID=94029 RepID=A0A8T0EU83_ARGBR|nr:programmed cell death protein 7-like [Argiope bruennichi]KAF8781650.1 Programmed cell death protein 7 like protein [Argiope bruennichi]
MEPMKCNSNNYLRKEIADDNFMEVGYPPNQVTKNENLHSQFPPQYSGVHFNSMSGHYPRQMNASISENYPCVPQAPGSSKPPIGSNNQLSGVSSNHLPKDGNMPFQNSSQHFQPYVPTLIPPVSSSSPLQTPVSSTENNQRPLFSMPPPVIPARNMDPMQFGQFHFPPPPIPPPAPYFPHGYVKNASSFHNNHSQQYFNNTPVQTVFPSASNMASLQSSNFLSSTMSQIISNMQSTSTVPENNTVISEKENLLNSFLQKFNFKEKHEAKSDITVAEFCSGLKKCYSLVSWLQSRRARLVSLLDSNQEEWEMELKHVKELQDKLSEACSVLSFPNNLATVQKKLKAIKRKRALKKKSRAIVLEQRAKKEQEREKLHQEIDKWLDNLKEKNEKMKREIEMKKEADNILSEVRRKIHEAKKTIEKLKVFEKLRSSRQTNSVQKGLYPHPEHSAKFEAKISQMREIMLAQLSNYEQEEKALQVMLETEQEDRREEEALWRKRKLMTFQQKKQKTILESLFGHFEEPGPDDPLFLFYQYQNSGNMSIDNLIQIRHHWDVYLSEEGESIPLQWVVPVPPSSSSWDEYCTS